MTSQLFREEAISRQGEKLWGDCMDLHSQQRWLFCGLLLLIFCLACVFLITGDYQRKEIVQGILVPDKGAVTIRMQADGIVEEVRYGQGDRVGKGDTLLVIEADMTTVGGAPLVRQILAENRRQEKLLQKLLAENESEYPSIAKHLDSEETNLRERITAQQGLIKNEASVRDLLASRLERMRRLQHRQLISVSDFEAVDTELLKQVNVLQRAQLELDNTRHTLKQVNEKRRQAVAEHRQERLRLEQELSTLSEQKLRMLSQQRFEIVSPASGTIAVLNRQEGQAVRSGQVIISIIQDDSILEAELLVPSRAIGFVENNLPVSLRLDTFPFRKYGSQPATVKSISRNILQPSENAGGASMKEPYYKVTAALNSQALQAHGVEVALRPGMQFQANIKLESRSLFQWLLEPLIIRNSIP